MDTTENPAVRISGPADLLSSVPYLLGFHPHDSLVLIGLNDHRLVVTARLDLVDVETRGRLVHDTLEAMVRGGTTEVVAAVYGYTLESLACHDALHDQLVEEVDEAGVELVDCMIVAAGRWRSYACKNRACCPVEGRALPDEPTVFQAEAVLAGVSVAASRGALEEQLAPFPQRHLLLPLIVEEQRRSSEAVTGDRVAGRERSVKRAIFAAARAASGPDAKYPSDRSAACIAVALTRLATRDAVWIAVDDGRLDGRELWLDLARRLPSPFDAAPMFLYGWHAWRCGNGALAGMAADRALASDPGYSAADLLLTVLARGVDPRQLPKLRRRSRGNAASTT